MRKCDGVVALARNQGVAMALAALPVDAGIGPLGQLQELVEQAPSLLTEEDYYELRFENGALTATVMLYGEHATRERAERCLTMLRQYLIDAGVCANPMRSHIHPRLSNTFMTTH